MTGGIEAIGSVVEGGLLARAIEPRAGESAEGHTRESACLNCGTVLVGPHCHGCGQAAHVHRTLGAFFHDLLHGVFHLEGKMWRTLPLLVFHPGRLTREYVEGRRASYISPIALFLFVVFLMFAVVQIGHAVTGGAEGQATTVEKSGRIVIDGNGAQGGGKISIEKTDSALLNKAIDKARQNPSLMVYKLQTNSYKFSWLLIPLSVPFVWLLFAWRRQFGPYDHAVFVTYSLCFVSLLYSALWILAVLGVPGSVRFLAAVLIPPVHIFAQLRGAYRLRRRSALWRTAALLVFIPIVLLLFFDALLVIGALD
jgi:hypothetical protein